LGRWIKSRGYSTNYFGAIVNCIKVVYRDAREIDGLHNFHETEKRGFASPSTASKAVYLTNDELRRIAEVQITPESLIAADATYAKMKRPDLERKVEALCITRNKFLLGAYTALRVSDFNYLRNINISSGYFRVTTKKTGASVVIPIHPAIHKMMEEGFDISTPISEQKINTHIKEVARLAGITQPVEATKLVNHRAVVDWWPKCDVITTHTARRSAATNMYKAGIPTISIMRITGHTTEKSFMKYIKITNEENAELMARNKYFM
jgi:integrase